MNRLDVQTHDDLACLCPADAEAHDALLMMALDASPTGASASTGLTWNNVEAYIPPSTHANTPQRQQHALKVMQLINRCGAEEAPQDLVHRTLKRITQHTQFNIKFASRVQPSYSSKPAFSFHWWRELGPVAAMFLLGLPMVWYSLSQARHTTRHADRHSLASVEHTIAPARYTRTAMRRGDLFGSVSQSIAPTTPRLASTTANIAPASASPQDLFFNHLHLDYPQLADRGLLPNQNLRPDKAIFASSSLSIDSSDPNSLAMLWGSPTPINDPQASADSSTAHNSRGDTVWLQRVVEDNTHTQQAFQTTNLLFVPVSNR